MEMPKNNSSGVVHQTIPDDCMVRRTTTQNLTSSLPAAGFLRLRQVLQIVPIGRSTLYQK
jgi:hypothetical protein